MFCRIVELNRKIDCNAVYKLLDEGLWWPLLEGKRLAIVSGQAEALAARLVEPEFVRSTGGNDVTWTIATTITCPPLNQPKHTHWPRMRDELFPAEWDLLLCSARSLSAVTCEVARQRRRKAVDTGSFDQGASDC